MDYKLAYILPSRERPQKFFEAVFNIVDYSESDNYEIIGVLDENDPSMNNDEIREKAKGVERLRLFYGASKNKIAACNREIDKISLDTSIVCLHSDDMRYLVYGFDETIRESFKRGMPNLDGVVHFNDGHQSTTMTYTMMGINMLKQLGYLQNPIYKSVYSDNDLTEMSKAMGKHFFSPENILLHLHPIFHLTDWDQLYRKNEAAEHYKTDGETFKQRKSVN